MKMQYSTMANKKLIQGVQNIAVFVVFWNYYNYAKQKNHKMVVILAGVVVYRHVKVCELVQP